MNKYDRATRTRNENGKVCGGRGRERRSWGRRQAGGGDHEFIVSGGAVRSPGGVSDGRGGIRRMVLWPLLRYQRVWEEITMGRMG